MRQGARDGSLNKHIRHAAKEDIDALVNLENICFKEETFHRKQLKYLVAKAKSITLLIVIDKNIAGSMIILLRKTISNARIYSFNVHPDYRRRGIGGSLMDHAIKILKEKGYKKITLEAGVHNQIALNLYASKGFIVDRTLLNYYRNGEDAFHLTMNL